VSRVRVSLRDSTFPMSSPETSAVAATAPASENASAPTGSSFEQTLNGFWAKNRKLVFLLCAVVVLVIVAREVLALNAAQSRERLAQGYAEAATTPEGLRRFAQDNAELPLGGVAWLQVADSAYEADNFVDAASAYEQSLKGLAKGTALADRAALGLAVSQLKSDAEEQGRVGLAALADNAGVSVAVRAEASYHLALFAHVAGEQDAFAQRAAQLAQIDPTSLWNQRLLSLQVTRSMSGAIAGATPTSPSVSTLPAALLTPAAQSEAEESAPTEEPSEPVIKFNLSN